jgi:hypothetical protein
MVGLSEDDMERIENFAQTPRYARSPEQLCEESEQEVEAEEGGA